MIDVKKLTVGFLILAVATGTSALIMSVESPGTSTEAAANVGASVQPNPAITGNAFLPSASDQGVSLTYDDPSAAALASSTEAAMNDPKNMTVALANAYLGNLVSANPSGPQDDGTGNMTLTPPDPDAVITQFAASSTPTTIQVPDWDTEAAEVPITIISSSPAVIQNYGAALGNILQNDIVSPGLQNSIAGDNTDFNAMNAAAGKISSALKDISGLKTPDAAADFQKSLIKTFVYAKNLIALSDIAENDPVKAEIIIEAEQTKYNTAAQDLQNEIQKIQAQKLFSFNENVKSEDSSLSHLQFIFGIPVANAQFAVTDPVAEAGVWATVGQIIANNLKDITLQLAKNMIVFAMQHFILSNIGKSGAPAFIQKWGDTLANAFQQSALAALNSQMLCVGAAPFAAQLRLTLGATYQPGNNNVCAVEYNSQLGNNLSTFYNNFSQGGGWLTFGETLQPDNNYYGEAFFMAQAIANTAQNAQNAASAKSVAGQGFPGSAKCDDGSNPNGTTAECIGATTGGYGGTPPCPNGYNEVQIPNNGTCADGSEPEVQTPGAVFNNMVGSALDGNFKLVTSANSWAGLGSGILISVLQQTLTSLATYSVSTVDKAVQEAAQNGGGNVDASGNYIPPQNAELLECDVAPPAPYGGSAGTTFYLTAFVSQPALSTDGSAPQLTTPTFEWKDAAGDIISQGADNIQVTPPTPGTYTYTVTDINPQDASSGQQPSATCQAVVQPSNNPAPTTLP